MSSDHETVSRGSDKISREAAHAAATQAYLREHDRWNQWMVFFFGIVAAVFLAWQQMKASIPLWVACFAAATVSALWLVASQNIRASSWAWLETLKDIESGRTTDTFAVYIVHHERYLRWADYKQTVNVVGGAVWRSVTRLLILIVTLLAFAFIAAGIAQLM